MINVARLRELMTYDPETGEFMFVKRRGYRKAGEKAGSITAFGYWRIRIDGKEYPAHRLAWLYVHGVWPENDLDHINLDKLDNRMTNLRIATPAQNNANQPLTIRNSSGFKGATWHKRCQKWQAAIKVSGKNIHLGLFESAEAAHDAYIKAAKEHYGEFARAS